MITSEQRKQIERIAYDAIKALTGEQYSLSMVSYVNASVNGLEIGAGAIVNGQFRFWNKSVNYYDYYDVEIKDNDIISIIPVEEINVSIT